MKLFRNRKGHGLTEYILMLALVAIAAISAVMYFSDNLRDQFQNVSEEVLGSNAVVGDSEDAALAGSTVLEYNMANYVNVQD